MQHKCLLEQFFFAYCIEAYKKDYLKLMHSLMHGLDGVAPFIK
jgi:hypothetical protein